MENKRKNLSPGTLTAPLPPAMVTVGDYENANIITIAWTGILASVPPKTYISVRPSRHSHGMLTERGEFVINLPSAELARTVDFVGIYTGAKMDKFEKCSLTKQKSEKVAPPTIAECPIALECRVCEVVPMGSHDVFIADIVGVSCHERLIDADGKIHYENADLLAYAHGEYYTLGDTVGRFGFSTDKQKKQAKREDTKKSEKKPRLKPAEADEGKKEHRPFYLDAPRGKGSRKKSPGKAGGRKKAVHK